MVVVTSSIHVPIVDISAISEFKTSDIGGYININIQSVNETTRLIPHSDFARKSYFLEIYNNEPVKFTVKFELMWTDHTIICGILSETLSTDGRQVLP